MDDKQLAGLIAGMTLGEKAALCAGSTAWHTRPYPEKGIPALQMADGPHGVRVEDLAHQKENGGPNKKATCFPPAATLACAFSPELTRQVGAAIAEEALHYGVGLLLGPGANLKRSPLGGRNFEYYSEDPLLSGELAAGFINGVQGKGVGASLKHYAVNNQEKYRMSIHVAVDERALFELYLRAFEIAVKKAAPDTVMASYNQVQGAYATEHRRLLTDILRLRFGFAGAVISDWGAVFRRPRGVAAGCDLEMPYSGSAAGAAIAAAVQNGSLSGQALDAACWNILRLVFRRTRQGQTPPPCDFEAHHALAAQALCKSAVLLKNRGAMLPLKAGGRVAVIGHLAEKPRYQGGGSSVINPKKLVSFLGAMKAEKHPFVYAAGYCGDTVTEGMLAAAVSAAQSCENVILFLGLPDAYECEGYDREHLDLPQSQLAVLRAVAAANPNVAVVLCCGGPVATPWLADVKALLCLHLGGQGLGDAAVQLLYGQCCPGGKLAESWPERLEDSPCYRYFPMGPAEVTYNESIYVGYRYYDTAGVKPRFPFGFGLSYTSFAFSALTLSAENLQEGETLRATFKLKNTGKTHGAEVAQAYLRRKNSAVYRPLQTLAGFARVELAAGRQREVRLDIPWEALAVYSTAHAAFVVESGEYELHIGACSRDLRLRARFTAEGVQLNPAAIHSAEGPYGNIQNNRFPAEHFAELYGKKLRSNALPKKGDYTFTTPLGLAQNSAAGKLLLCLARGVARRTVHFSQDPNAAEKAALATTFDLPFKNLAISTNGIVGPQTAAALLDLCNGRGSAVRVLRLFFRRA